MKLKVFLIGLLYIFVFGGCENAETILANEPIAIENEKENEENINSNFENEILSFNDTVSENKPEKIIVYPRNNSYVNSMKSIETGFQVVQFGSYEQDGIIENGTETIDWYVLAEEDDKIMLISKYALEYKKFNDTNEAITWETSDLRKWLNDDFYNAAFDEEEQKFICDSIVENPDNHWTGVKGGNDTVDKVYILGFDEICKYFDICWQVGGYDDKWMTIMSQEALCTPTDYVVNNYEDAECFLFESMAFSNGTYYDYGFTDDALGVEDIQLWIRTNGDSPNYMLYTLPGNFQLSSVGGTRIINEEGIRPVIWVDKSVVYGN